MGNFKQNIVFTIIILAFFCEKGDLRAQTFVNPFIEYGVTKFSHIASDGTINPNEQTKVIKVSSPKVSLGFSIVKYLNKYLSVDLQLDFGYQKMQFRDNGFVGLSGANFWHFRNSIIAYRNFGEKWRTGIGVNFDYLTSNHISLNLIRNRVELGGVFQIEYHLNKAFNIHLNYRHGFKAIDIRPTNFDPLQSFNLGLGYRFQIKK